MKYKVSDLVRDIRIAIDQNMTSKALENIADVDTLSLNDIVRSKVVEAARLVGKVAHPSFIDNGVVLNGTVQWKSAVGVGTGQIVLPDHFMRLLSFQMSDWSRPATIIDEDDIRYLYQSSRYPGVRGCPQRPIAAVCRRQQGMVVEFYSCTAGSSVFLRQALYLAEPKIDDEDNIDISTGLKDPIIYKSASLVLYTMRETDTGDKLNEISKSFLL